MKSRLGYLPWIIGIGLLMENIDTTIINTSIPQIAKSLNIYPISLKIGITSYLLTLAAFIPISGYLSDKYGTKRIFSFAMLIFLLGSAICGFAHHLTELVIGRLVQGVGGAMMTPTGRLILIRAFPKSELVKVFSYLTLVGQLGPAIGPVLGGVLTTYAHWRFIFFVNIPVGIIALILVKYFLDNFSQEHLEPFDTFGFILFGLSAGLITFSLTLLTEQAPFLDAEILMLLVGIVLIIIFCLHAKNTPHPSLDLRLLRVDSFRIAVFGSFIVRIGVGGIPFLIPLLFQLNFGVTAFESGLLTLPYGIALLVAKPLVKKLLKLYGFKKLLIVNPLLISIALSMLLFINKQSSLLYIISVIFLIGFFGSLQFTYMNVLNFVDIKQEDSSKATSFSSVAQQLAMSFGVCTGAGLLVAFNGMSHSNFVTLSAFKCTFFILALIALFSSVVFSRLKKESGSSI